MKKSPRGICLIISNETFDHIPNKIDSNQNQTLENLTNGGSSNQNSKFDRPGTHADEGSLETIFKWLGFQVMIERNCTVEDIQKKLTEVSGKDHGEFDAFICCILSHGYHCEKDGCSIYGTDWKLKPLTEIKERFEGILCPSLLRKPKIFIVQACNRDEVCQTVKQYMRATESDETNKSMMTASEHVDKADNTIGMSTYIQGVRKRLSW